MIEVLKQWAEDVSKVYDILAFGHTERALEILAKTRISLRQAITELESQESNPIKDGWKLSVANGHSGYGVYAHMEEYPEEGAFLLLSIKELESQEPLCTAAMFDDWFLAKSGLDPKTPLYTHPPQRTWVGLTDEEVNNAIKEKNITPLFTYRMIARTIEAKLKEKNGFFEENT